MPMSPKLQVSETGSNCNRSDLERRRYVIWFSVRGDCPLSSSHTSCAPKCLQDTDCATSGQICCPNLCNAKSCARPTSGSSSGSGAFGSKCTQPTRRANRATSLICFQLQPHRPLAAIAETPSAAPTRNATWTDRPSARNAFALEMFRVFCQIMNKIVSDMQSTHVLLADASGEGGRRQREQNCVLEQHSLRFVCLRCNCFDNEKIVTMIRCPKTHSFL